MPGAFRPDVTLPALWTDRGDWATRLRALAATGHIDQTEAENLAHFADHGWLVLPQAIEPDLIEFDVGEWTGRTFASLDADGGDAQTAEWRRFNTMRSLTRPPGGERNLTSRRARVEKVRLGDVTRGARDLAGVAFHAERFAGPVVGVVEERS